LARGQGALSGFAALIAKLRTRIGVLPLPEMLDAVLESWIPGMLADGSERAGGGRTCSNALVTTRYDDSRRTTR